MIKMVFLWDIPESPHPLTAFYPSLTKNHLLFILIGPFALAHLLLARAFGVAQKQRSRQRVHTVLDGDW